MPTPLSTDTYQDVFSAAPLYSVDPPPVLSDPADLSAVLPRDSGVIATCYLSLTPAYDPYVVSTEPEDRDTYGAAAAFAQLWRNSAEQHECTQSVFLDQDLSPTLPGYLPFLSILSSNLHRSVVTAVRNELVHRYDAGVSPNKWLGLASVTSLSKFQRCLDEVWFKAAALEYFTIFSNCLRPRSFSTSDEYDDPLGGRVTDYFRDDERLTCIVSASHVQVLSFLRGTFQEKIFDRKATIKLSLVEYLEGLLGDEEAHELGSTEDS